MLHNRHAALLLSLSLLLAVTLPARAALPPDFEVVDFVEARYAVLLDQLQDRQLVKPGAQFTLGLRLTPHEAFHLYGNNANIENGETPTVLTLDAVPGVTWDALTYPATTAVVDPFGETVQWLKGQSLITVRGTLSADTAVGLLKLPGKIAFGACTEDFCLAPSEVPVEWNVEVVAADYAGTQDVSDVGAWSSPVETDLDRFSLPADGPVEPASDERIEEFLNELQATTLSAEEVSLGKMLLFALLGGLILNFMPCVLPVVSIKVISMARHAEHEHTNVLKQALAFCGGILFCFLVLAVIVILIQQGGEQLGWGFQFQDPVFVIIMSTVIFAFGLSLAGVYTIKPPRRLTEAGEHLAEQEGYAGSFFKGVLATLLGTPCVGPFLGPALGYAFTQPPAIILAMFGAVGVGMAAPYIPLVVNPWFRKLGQRERGRLVRSIGESKGWLTDFERVMAFLMFFTVIYLLNILYGSMGGEAVVWTLMFLTAVAFGLWLWGRLSSGNRASLLAGFVLVPLLILGSGWYIYGRIFQPPALEVAGAELAWEPFTLDALYEHTLAGHTVLVDFTADWCPNCRYNEATALNVEGTQAVVAELQVVTLQADWTARNPEITRALRALDRSSIPLTAIFPAAAPDKPILLDGVFTAAQAQDALRRAVAIKMD